MGPPNMRSGALPKSVVKELFTAFGGTCLIADCAYAAKMNDGTPILELAFIYSYQPGGVRYSPDRSVDELRSVQNLILVCPKHHRVIDQLPHEYPGEKLELLRTWHIERVSNILKSVHRGTRGTRQVNKLQEALNIWHRERTNQSESFWQKLLAGKPELLMRVLGGQSYVLGQQCYVGGKAIDNKGGKVPDFLLQSRGSAVLVELKTPTTKLLGPEYRSGVFPPSSELIGAYVQALEYRMSLMNNLHALTFQTPGLSAHSPSTVVISGDAENELKTQEQRRSFELFRTSLRDVSILTFDELFSGVADVLTILDSLDS